MTTIELLENYDEITKRERKERVLWNLLKANEKHITGIEYMDDPDAFDLFSEKYEQYRTLGDPDNMPAFFDNETT